VTELGAVSDDLGRAAEDAAVRAGAPIQDSPPTARVAVDSILADLAEALVRVGAAMPGLTPEVALPGLTRINLVGYVVVRDDEGRPAPLEQARVSRHDPLPARYAVVYERFADARTEAEEQLVHAYASCTYAEDARHVVPIVIRNCEMRDFRPTAMRQVALEIAADRLASGDADEPWGQLARRSAGGLILPWRPETPHRRNGYFILVVDRFVRCVALEEPIERIHLDDVVG
jgi:hypothetical protein